MSQIALPEYSDTRCQGSRFEVPFYLSCIGQPNVDWSRTLLPFLSLHALAAQRGDGLRPELLALLLRHARSEIGLGAEIESDETKIPCEPTQPAQRTSANEDLREECQAKSSETPHSTD
ncbi:hypothetical protein F0160_25820 [Paraburkholderia sp. JPY303]|uniref:hypothetical protein n=1 Tax=Paraburkholderia atlantica TaxID=2654982 RepID=UPI00158F9FA7|nr:hypothetical protein [Paraburkholderia atlantica]NUY33896.1 hypothetical protein [Paraburkholderia atlantica]